MHALIETDTLTDRGQRNDFGGNTPSDLSHKNPPLKWVPVVKATDPAFDSLTQKLQKAADVITLTELTQGKEVVALSAGAASSAQREAQRATMRANWSGLPDSIKANYNSLFRDVQSFLDAGQDNLAALAVQEVDPIKAISDDPTGRLVQFEAARTQFINAINNLPAV